MSLKTILIKISSVSLFFEWSSLHTKFSKSIELFANLAGALAFMLLSGEHARAHHLSILKVGSRFFRVVSSSGIAAFG